MKKINLKFALIAFLGFYTHVQASENLQFDNTPIDVQRIILQNSIKNGDFNTLRSLLLTSRHINTLVDELKLPMAIDFLNQIVNHFQNTQSNEGATEELLERLRNILNNIVTLDEIQNISDRSLADSIFNIGILAGEILGQSPTDAEKIALPYIQKAADLGSAEALKVLEKYTAPSS